MKALNDKLNLELCVKVDRKRFTLHDYNELSRYERDEAKLKHGTELAVRNKFNDELKLELSVDVDRIRS